MILVRYVLKELIGPFLAALFGITFLFVVDFLVKILDNVLSKGQYNICYYYDLLKTQNDWSEFEIIVENHRQGTIYNGM